MLPIVAYNVYWDANYLLSENFELLATINSFDQFFHTVDGLNAGDLLRFQVASVNAIGEGPLSAEVQSYAQSLPGPPDAPVRVSSEQDDSTTASITLEWNPLLDTGGVPLTGYKVYATDSMDNVSLVFDGTDSPEIL